MKVKNLNGGSKWHHRKFGVIYVEHDWQKDDLHKLLCRQDDHWRSRPFLIQTWFGPKSLKEVQSEAKYTDKTDIYEVEELRKIIPFIFFQFDDLGCVEENH